MRIILVEPQHPGNVGAVARVMVNFGIDELALVKGCEIDDDGYARSKSGKPILENLSRFDTLEGALADCDVTIATSGIKPEGDKRWFRAPKGMNELPELVKEREKPAIVFGRENYGLYREELALCEVTITIPTNPEYPILNLSHAVGIVLYEIYRHKDHKNPKKRKVVSNDEFERLVDRIMDLLEETSYPKRRLNRSKTTLRRLISRGKPDEGEYENLMGIFKAIKEGKR
ncbi:MAG: RNA methyltransferase [Candidatus Thermoplasmatota archaeon]|nr:RNA methyltransferase [Candidatus Thermoplasmatota archaeon]MED6305486.1 RNA methyltransferase [Candidatus Thermoplasmatota archaeon]